MWKSTAATLGAADFWAYNKHFTNYTEFFTKSKPYIFTKNGKNPSAVGKIPTISAKNSENF